jgi:hypothetical protein
MCVHTFYTHAYQVDTHERLFSQVVCDNKLDHCHASKHTFKHTSTHTYIYTYAYTYTYTYTYAYTYTYIHIHRCTFEDDIEFEHPALTTFANCKFACLTFVSLHCTALEFEPDNPGLLDLADGDLGRCVT